MYCSREFRNCCLWRKFHRFSIPPHFFRPQPTMDTQQLSIDTLLTAARLLETHLAAAQHQTGQAQGLSFAASQLSPLPLPNTQSTVLLPAAVLAASSLPQQLHNPLVVASSSPLEYSIGRIKSGRTLIWTHVFAEQQADFRDLVGKIRVAGSPKFCSSASTSAYPYNVSPSPSRKSSASKNSRLVNIPLLNCIIWYFG